MPGKHFLPQIPILYLVLIWLIYMTDLQPRLEQRARIQWIKWLLLLGQVV